MKTYRVYINDEYSDGGFIVCKAKNKTEAREKGRLYIKQWRLRYAKIVKIIEIISEEV